MKHATAAYAEGVQSALGAFGVRVAAHLEGRRMPDGPEHLGAEWLSRVLSRDHADAVTPGKAPAYKKLERPPIWGVRASLEASGTPGHDYSGMTPYGGV